MMNPDDDSEDISSGFSREEMHDEAAWIENEKRHMERNNGRSAGLTVQGSVWSAQKLLYSQD